MKLNRSNLIQDMNKVLPGIATDSIVLENADTVVFNNGHIYSYNSAISVDVVETEPTGLKGVVKGIDFYNCLTKLPGDEIEVETTDEAWVIHDNTIKVKIKLLPEGKLFERFESLKPTEEWSPINSEDFEQSLRICNMPKNRTRFAGIYFKDNIVISTDSYTINRYMCKDKYPEMWLSNSVVSELLKWNNFTQVQLNKMWFQLKTSEGTVFSVRTLNLSKFPIDKLENVINKQESIEPDFVSEFTDDFYSAINRAASFSSEDDGHEIVCFNIFADCSVITSERMSGAYEEKIFGITSEKPINLKLDVNMIQDCAAFFKKFKIVTMGENINIILNTDSSIKIIATIV